MLQPKREKYRKRFKPNMKGDSARCNQIQFGDYGLQSLGRKWLTARQIESARKVIVREMKRKGKLWIRVFPDRPITSKPNEVGMGKGKGEPEQYVMALKPGRMIFEISGVSEAVAREAFRKAGQKLPILTKILVKS